MQIGRKQLLQIDNEILVFGICLLWKAEDLATDLRHQKLIATCNLLNARGQIELDLEVERAAKNAPPAPAAEEAPETLAAVEETTSEEALSAALMQPAPDAAPAEPAPEEEEYDPDAVFAKLSSLKEKLEGEAPETEDGSEKE